MQTTGYSPPGTSTNKYSSSATQSTPDGLTDIRRAMAAPAITAKEVIEIHSSCGSEEDRDAIALLVLQENEIAKELAIQRKELEQIKIQKQTLERRAASAQVSF